MAQRISCFKQRPTIISSKDLIAMKLTPRRLQRPNNLEMLLCFISGYDQLEIACFGSRYQPALLGLKQYISSNGLEKLPWSKILLHWSKGTNQAFPFEDKEWLDFLQVYDEKIALKRLLQSIFHIQKFKR